MSDLGSEILKKYGTPAVIFAAVASVIIWSLAHWTAAPGKEVSVLWGLVKYTKQPKTASTSPSSINKIVAHPNQQIKQEGTPDKLPEINIVTRNGISNENLQNTLSALRSQIKLRELSAMESGKIVKDLPAGIVFYLSAIRIENSLSNETLLSKIELCSAKRYPTYSEYIEIHKTFESELYLIGFVSEIDAAEISKLSGEKEHSIVVATNPWGQFTSLVSIPIKRILSSKVRDIQMAESKEASVLDTIIQ